VTQIDLTVLTAAEGTMYAELRPDKEKAGIVK
jgi:hypothetical protein